MSKAHVWFGLAVVGETTISGLADFNHDAKHELRYLP